MNVLKIIETLQQNSPLNILDADTKIFDTRGWGHHIRNIVSNPVCPRLCVCYLLESVRPNFLFVTCNGQRIGTENVSTMTQEFLTKNKQQQK